MHVIALHLLFTVMFNPVTTNPANMEEYHTAFVAQFEQPVIVADYSNLND